MGVRKSTLEGLERLGVKVKTVLNEEQLRAVEILREAGIESEEGLSEDLFLLVSSLVPLPNVDLLVTDKDNRILLTRRNDEFFQKSWHIPGGTMRYGESFDTAIRKTAQRELGCTIEYNPTPIAVRNVIRGQNLKQRFPRERGHNVAILFRCFLPENYVIDNRERSEDDNGYIKWFEKLPDNFMKIQYVYKDVLGEWIKEKA